MYITLSRAKARRVVSVFNNPLHTDMINNLEAMYSGVLDCIGNKGRLNDVYYIDVDRDFSKGIFTSKLRLSIKASGDEMIDLGEVVDVQFRNDELRIELVDGIMRHAVILYAEE